MALKHSVPARPTNRELLEKSLNAIADMISVVEDKSDNLCSAVQEQTKVQSEDIKSRKDLRQKQLESLESEDIDRRMNRLVLLHEKKIITKEEFEERMKSLAQF